jgi:hypothetical protein
MNVTRALALPTARAAAAATIAAAAAAAAGLLLRARAVVRSLLSRWEGSG